MSKTRTRCSHPNRIGFWEDAIMFDPLVNVYSFAIQFLILRCWQGFHAKLFVCHLGWKLSAAITMKELNLRVIPRMHHCFIVDSAQSTVALVFFSLMDCTSFDWIHSPNTILSLMLSKKKNVNSVFLLWGLRTVSIPWLNAKCAL